MKFQLYQIAIVALSSLMLFQGIFRFIKGRSNQTFLKLFIRIIVWGGMALIAIFPNFSNSLAKTIGIQGNVNAVILIGFILVFLMVFKLLSAIERLEQQISELTRKDSLKDINKN